MKVVAFIVTCFVLGYFVMPSVHAEALKVVTAEQATALSALLEKSGVKSRPLFDSGEGKHLTIENFICDESPAMCVGTDTYSGKKVSFSAAKSEKLIKALTEAGIKFKKSKNSKKLSLRSIQCTGNPVNASGTADVLVYTCYLDPSAVVSAKPADKTSDFDAAKALLKEWIDEKIKSYEAPNAVIFAQGAVARENLKAILESQDAKTSVVTDAHYFAAVYQYTDEGNLYYFALKKGKDSKPKQVLEINLADLDRESLPRALKNPAVWGLNVRGVKTWPYDQVPGEYEGAE